MTLEQPTQQHLTRARRNRDVADVLVGPAAQGIISPPALEWAVVAALNIPLNRSFTWSVSPGQALLHLG